MIGMLRRGKASTTASADAASISIVALTLWLALVAGFGEILIRIAPPGERFARVISLQPQLLGLIPLAELVLLLPIALILLLVRLRRRGLSVKAALLVLGFLPILSLTFNPSIHIVAMLLLAGGVTNLAARLVARYPLGFKR